MTGAADGPSEEIRIYWPTVAFFSFPLPVTYFDVTMVGALALRSTEIHAVSPRTMERTNLFL